MTLDTPHFTTLSDAQHDRASNADIPLDYGTTGVTATRHVFADDRADDITLTTFARLRNRDLNDLRVSVLATGESWPPRRQWFQGYAAAHGLTL